MKKILLLFVLVLSGLAFGSDEFLTIDEYKTDVYFANGILTDEGNATANTLLLEKSIRINRYNDNEEEMYKHIGKVKEMWNETYGIAGDIIESLLQKLYAQDIFDEIVDLLSYTLFETSHSRNLSTQIKAYRSSIKSGHKVLVVAHSQGNLFTNEAYRNLDDWMKEYFDVVSVASPAMFPVCDSATLISWDNDVVAWLGIYNSSMVSNDVRKIGWERVSGEIASSPKPPTSYIYKTQMNEIFNTDWKPSETYIDYSANGSGAIGFVDDKVHAFTFYMGENLVDGKVLNPLDGSKLHTDKAKNLIMAAIDTKMNLLEALPSQWKPKPKGCVCKKKYAKMIHIHDPDSMDKYLKSYKVKDFVEGEAGKIYVAKKEGAEVYVRATYGGVNIEEVDEENSDVCYALKDDSEDASTIGEIEGAKTPQVIAQDGAIEVTINWSHMCDINMDLTLEGDNVIQDVKDVENLSFEHAYVASKAQIYPNTTYTAYAYGNKKENSGLEEEELEDDPVIIHAVVKTPTNSRFAVYEAKDYASLNLKRFAWIEIEEDKSISISSDTNSSGGGSGPRSYDECRDSDKKYTCDCVPCEYIIKGFKNSVELGPIADAEVEIISADTYGSNMPNVVYRGKTTNHSSIFKTGLVKLNQSDYSNFEDDAYYVVSAKGGEDVDRDDDFIRDITPTQNNGTLHAIIKGSDLKLVAFRVNALTEAIYQVSGELLGVGYDTEALDEKLDDAAKRLFTEKTFVFNNEVDINYHDVLLWVPAVDKRILLKPYDIFVEPIVVKIYADEARIKESYKLIYEKLDTDAPQLRPLALEIPYTIPTNSIIGKVNIVSEGVNGIDHIELHGDVNSSFSIDKEGFIKVVESSEFIIDALYKLDMIAVGTGGKRSISMELIVKVIEGTPLADPNATVPTLESIELFDIVENSPSGTVVGQANFIDSNLSIVEHKISGEDNVSFSIDDSGEITIANGAEIDYEKSDTYSISISAVNEAGNESFPIKLSIGIINEIDTPLFDLVYLLNINENIPIGTIIGKIEQSREGRSPIRSFDILNPNVPFGIDVNGTIRTTKYINYEDEDEYNLIAIARTDSGDSNKVDLQIFVKDIEPEVGKPSLQEFTVTIDENTSEGTEIGVLDVNQGASLVGLIELRGVGNSHFRVDNNGTITVAQKVILDYEQKNTYTLQAIAYNANGSSDLVSVHIILNDVVDEQPSLYRFTKSIDENTSSNTVVGKLKIRSMGDGTITGFTLSGVGAENFTIDENGTIRVSSSATLDYEATSSYALQARVLSDAGESDATQVRIYILKIPENLPVLKPLTLSIEENASIGTVVGTVQEDVGGDSPIISYSLDDNSTFSIDANGTLRVVGVLDYETQTSHTLQVRASNGAGTSNPVPVTINISNIIDDEPMIDIFEGTIEENATIGTVVGKIDVISEGNAPIESYSITGDDGRFYIDTQTAELRVNNILDFEDKAQYDFDIEAVNAIGKSQSVHATVFILDRVDHEPVVKDTILWISQSSNVGDLVGFVSIDSRGSKILSVRFEGDDAQSFVIENNGSVYLREEIVFPYYSYVLDIIALNIFGVSDTSHARVFDLQTIEGTKYEDVLDLSGRVNTCDESGSWVNENYAIFGFEGDDLLCGSMGRDMLKGGWGNDILYADYASTWDDEIHYSNYLEGGKGNDMLYGGSGDDTYVYHRGDGHDTIYDRARVPYGQEYELFGGDDTLWFTSGISMHDVMLKIEGKDLIIGLKEENKTWDELNDTIRVTNWIFPENRIENFLFEDDASVGICNFVYCPKQNEQTSSFIGTANSEIMLDGFFDSVYSHDSLITGLGGDDVIIVDGYNTSVIIVIGGKGDDRIYNVREDDCTYIFNRGDGHDTIYNTSLNDWDSSNVTILQFGSGISPEELILTTKENTLFIAFESSDDKIDIVDWNIADNNSVWTFTFDNNITWDVDTILLNSQ